MATRNERKRRAKARRLELLDSAIAGLLVEHEKERKANESARQSTDDYPFYDELPKSSNGVMVERLGSTYRGGRKGLPRFKPSLRDKVEFGPLKGDTDTGAGERRKKYS